jgi:site-specific recombinase XerD
VTTVSLAPKPGAGRWISRSAPVYRRHDEDLDDPVRVGPIDDMAIEDVLMLSPAVVPWGIEQSTERHKRLTGARVVLQWLLTHPGAGWQQRWRASGADDGLDWVDDLAMADMWADAATSTTTRRQALMRGLCFLLICQLVRPSYAFLMAYRAQGLFLMVRQVRRPDLFAKVEDTAEALGIRGRRRGEALSIITKLVMHTGRDVDGLTAEDLLVYRSAIVRRGSGSRPDLAWELLRPIADLGGHATLRDAVRPGQSSTVELVDAYPIRCRPLRDIFIRYLNERRPSLDYASLANLAILLIANFWVDIENHHPGIDSLHLPDDVAQAWKQRLQVVVNADGSTRPRKGYLSVLMQVRAFYLDIQQWAVEDPSWAAWAVPCPVRKGETDGFTKNRKATTARMHQRVRDRMPHLHLLVDTAGQHRSEQAALLAAAQTVEVGQTFTHDGRQLRRIASNQYDTNDAWLTVKIEDLNTAEPTDLTRAEDEAFWSWAVIETLRHTGIRVEELTEITHCALVQYTMPKTGELVPMLQIVPSKNNAERLLMLSPEMTSVLATIISRLRARNAGTVPLTARYDPYERLTGDPLPHLFARQYGWRWEVPSYTTITKLLTQALSRTGLQDAAGKPLRFTPHDFRRIFATEALTEGLPVHIVARVLGHANINTSQAYMAVFDEELIKAYRSFVQRRRAARPTDEYREPTDAEWREFQQHFETRKLALGECGRPYQTPCNHEHACVRCPSLRVDPNQRHRLVAIIENLKDRIRDAELNGWAGEINGLTATRDAAINKLLATNRAVSQLPTGAINLGITPIISS